mgnify:CR=1 FL=1
MASKKENDLERERIELLKEQNRLAKEKLAMEKQALQDNRDSENVLNDQLKQLKFQASEKRLISSISRRITKELEDSYTVEMDMLGTGKSRLSIEKKLLQAKRDEKSLNSFINELTEAGVTVSDDLNRSIKERIEDNNKLTDQLKEQLKLNEEIRGDKGVKFLSGLEEISKKIPGLSKFTDAFKDASDAAKKQAVENKKAEKADKARYAQRAKDMKALGGSGGDLNKDAIKRLGLENKLVGKNGKALHGAAAAKKANAIGAAKMVKPLKAATKGVSALRMGLKVLAKGILKAFGPIGLLIELIMAIFRGDKAAGELAKAMNMTYTEALATRRELTMMAEESGNIFVTTKGMQESLMFINQTLGSNAMLSADMLTSFTKLREAAGFTNEELMGIAKLSFTTGKDMDKITGEMLGQAKITSAQNKVALNEKEIVKEVSKLSAATTLSLSKNPRLLAEAVTQAKALGMTMEQIEKSSEALLNFEQSITNELKAELLLGKNINLEKARLASLNNDIVTFSKEISNQIGTSADFAKMNRIQQKALAEAVGMSREELAQTLFTQEALGNATGEEAEKRRAVIAGMLKTMSIEEAQRKLEQEGIENLEHQASVQERFNAMLDKLTEIAVQIGEPLLEIISPLADLAGWILPKITGSLQFVVGIFKMIILGIKGIVQSVGELINLIPGVDIDTGDGPMATFKEAGSAFTRGANRTFDVQYGKDSMFNINETMGMDADATLFGDNSYYNRFTGNSSNSNEIREQTDYMRMSSQRQEELLQKLTSQNEALLSEAQESNRSYLYGG